MSTAADGRCGAGALSDPAAANDGAAANESAAANDGALPGDGELIAVGRIGPARGVRGAVFVEPWTDSPLERFAPGAQVRCADGNRLEVAESALAAGRLVVRFTGSDDREAGEALRGTQLFVLAADRPALEDPDEFYDSDLAGLLARDRDGAVLGEVVQVSHVGAADYLLVRVEGREHLVPFVAAIVPEVDVAAGYVVLDVPAGLFEL